MPGEVLGIVGESGLGQERLDALDPRALAAGPDSEGRGDLKGDDLLKMRRRSCATSAAATWR